MKTIVLLLFSLLYLHAKEVDVTYLYSQSHFDEETQIGEMPLVWNGMHPPKNYTSQYWLKKVFLVNDEKSDVVIIKGTNNFGTYRDVVIINGSVVVDTLIQGSSWTLNDYLGPYQESRFDVVKGDTVEVIRYGQNLSEALFSSKTVFEDLFIDGLVWFYSFAMLGMILVFIILAKILSSKLMLHYLSFVFLYAFVSTEYSHLNRMLPESLYGVMNVLIELSKVVLFFALAGFTSKYFDLWEKFKQKTILLYVPLAYPVVNFVLFVFNNKRNMLISIDAYFVVYLGCVVLMGVVFAILKKKWAKEFVISWSPMIAGLVIYELSHEFTIQHASPLLGHLLEMFAFAFFISKRCMIEIKKNEFILSKNSEATYNLIYQVAKRLKSGLTLLEAIPKDQMQRVSEDFKVSRNRLIQTIRHVRAFVELDKEDKSEWKWIKIQQLLFDIRTQLGGTYPDVKIVIDVEEGMVHEGERIALSDLLWNLLDNACKFNTANRVFVSAKVTAALELIVEIQDQGPGFDVTQISDFHDGIKQPHTAINRQHEGLGLGLHLAFKTAKRLGYELDFYRLKTGMMVQVNLGVRHKILPPIFPTYNPKKEFEELAHPIMNDETSSLGSIDVDFKIEPWVLIVDDNAINLKVIKRILEKLEFKVLTASNGKEGLELFGKFSAELSLILMDIQMPILDGLEATRQIRSLETKSHIPILAISAHGDEEWQTKVIEAGMDEMIKKPFTKNTIIEALKRHDLLNETKKAST